MKNLNEKFQSLVNGTTGHEFNGVCGTNQNERSEIVREVYTSLGESITIEVNGVNCLLKKSTSLSGKTIAFYGPISNEEYILVGGDTSTLKKNGGATIELGATGIVTVRNGGNHFFKLENKKVTILK